MIHGADISLADIHQYYREIGKRVDENIEMSLRNFITKRRHAGVQITCTNLLQLCHSSREANKNEPAQMRTITLPNSIDETTKTTVSALSEADNNPFFIPNLTFTPSEESKVIRILDTRLFPWVLLTTFVLNMDRTNLSNAISDNLPKDLGFTTNTVNLGTAIYSVLFSLACLGGAVVCKIVHPARWIPFSMFCWGLVTMSHALIKDKGGYLTVRCMIAVTEGGVIPATLIYLGSFYRSTELATRLAWFWGCVRTRRLEMALPGRWDHYSGRCGVELVVSDDPSKRLYEQRVHWEDVKDAATDLGLWGHLLITAVGLTPTTPLGVYLPSVIKTFNFSIFVANALTAPPYILQCCTTVLFIWHSDRIGERGFHGAFGATWQLVGWILLRCLPSDTSKGVKYFAALLVACWPYTHPLNIAWMSENTGSIGKRTLASGCVIFAANIYGVWGSQIYQAKDAPDYRTGNTINIVFAGTAVCLWFVQKGYYKYRNARNAKVWAELGEDARKRGEISQEVEGNRSRPPATSANGTKNTSAHNSKIWSTSSVEERERIKEFWLGLGEEERRNLVKIEKDTVLRKMKEQQKHSCSCAVCGRKRNAIEEELEVLYDAYYEELEQYANYQQRYVSSGGTIPPPPGPGPFPGSVELDKNGAVVGHPGHPQHVAPHNHRPNNANAKAVRGGKAQAQPQRTNIPVNGRGKPGKHPPPESEFDDADDDPNVDPDADLDDDEYEEEDDDGEDYEEEDEEDEEEDPDPDPDPDDEELSPNPNLPAHPGVNGVGIGRGRGTPVRPGTTPQLGVRGGAGGGRGRGRGAESPLNGTENGKNQGRNGLFNLGSSLTVTGPGNILTVADDLLKNDGQKFLEMMEQLAERRMQREEEAVGDLEDDSEDEEDEDDEDGGEDEEGLGSEDDDEDLDRRRRRRRQRDVEDEGSDDEEDEEDEEEEEDEEDEEDEEEEVMTEEQKMEEGKRMFSIFAARMFEQRVLKAYREKVAQERQLQFLRELEDENKSIKEREAKKQNANQKKKDKKKQQKLAKESEKARRDAEKIASENAAKAQQAALEEEQRKKREEERVKREAFRKAQELEKAKKEEEKRKRKEEERKKRMEVEKEREKERERKRKEAKEREAKEAKEAKERSAALAIEKEKKDKEEREKREKEEKERKAREEKEKTAERERLEKERERKEKEAREKKEKEDRERELREKKAAAAAAVVNPKRSISGSGPQSPRASGSGSGSTSPSRSNLNGVLKKNLNATGKASPVVLSVSAPSLSTLIPSLSSAPVSIPGRSLHPGQQQFQHQQQPGLGGPTNHLSQPRPLVANMSSSMTSGPSTPIASLHAHMHMGPPTQTPVFGQPLNMGSIPHQPGLSPRVQHGPYSPAPFGSFAPMQQQQQPPPPHSGPSGPPPGHGLAPSALPRGFTGSGPGVHTNGASSFDPPTSFTRGVPGAPPPAPIGPPLKLNTLPGSASAGPSSALAPGSSPIQAAQPRRMSLNHPELSGPGPITRPMGSIAPIGSGAPVTPIAPIARPSAIINTSSTSTSESAIAGPSNSLPSSGSGSPVRNSPHPRRTSSPKGVLGSSALAADDDEVVPVNKGRRPGNVNVGQGWGPTSPSRAGAIGGGAIDRGLWGPPAPVNVGMNIHNPLVSPIGGFVNAPRSAGLWGSGLVPPSAPEWHQPYPNSFIGQAQAQVHTATRVSQYTPRIAWPGELPTTHITSSSATIPEIPDNIHNHSVNALINEEISDHDDFQAVSIQDISTISSMEASSFKAFDGSDTMSGQNVQW
ncbi:MFS general substrate transporter [Lentinula edodes]|uniref:Stress response protein NST1 n=2 Tax=Lentinula edodes TaxID=5353 RepID=A0A1Q3ERI0_LENED|nr:MFS general substrate transporter [Lentinula edodes]